MTMVSSTGNYENYVVITYRTLDEGFFEDINDINYKEDAINPPNNNTDE